MNRILLLDIDGVILPEHQSVDEIPKTEHKSKFLRGFSFDNLCCQRVDKLCRENGYKIMLISTWRKVFYEHDNLLKEVLINSGVSSVHFRADWLVPYKFTSSKIHELGFVVRMLNEEDLPMEILVLDDSYLEVETWNNEQITFRQVKPDSEIGFSETDYQDAINCWVQ